MRTEKFGELDGTREFGKLVVGWVKSVAQTHREENYKRPGLDDQLSCQPLW
jgi:hypothetical protein